MWDGSEDATTNEVPTGKKGKKNSKDFSFKLLIKMMKEKQLLPDCTQVHAQTH